MTILLYDGLDMYNGVGGNTGIQSKWTSLSGVVGASMVSGRFGGQALQAQGASADTVMLGRSFTPAASFSVNFAFFVSTLNTHANDAVIVYLTNGATAMLSINLATTTQKINVARNTSLTGRTVLGTGTTTVAINTWYFCTLECDIDDTAGTVRLWINGVKELDLSAQDTRNGTPTTVDTVYHGVATTATGLGKPTVLHDDIYVTSTSTSPGEMRVETLRPSSDAITETWTPNSGGTNFSRVNEAVVDGDTSYVGTGTVGNRDLYGIGSLSSTPSTILAAQVVLFAEKTDATTRTLYSSVKSNTTDSDGSAVALAASYLRYERMLTVDPATGAAWTASGVNNLLIGPKLAS